MLFCSFLGFIPSITAQSIVDSNEKIGYTHYKTPVNGFLMHYVIGGKGDPIVLLHGWPETWYEWRHIIPELIANNYTVAWETQRDHKQDMTQKLLLMTFIN